mmetsp:Transcript_60063/g.173153  ORF Transcript_60063/g.173153 Transcript_60063/m.173153 type:complete len:555 (-) Transcript_60063:178-1842(-)
MVEVKLDTDDCMKLDGDHYVSVRIGEAQKLAKMAPSRTYRFPSSAIGNRKYGKIEVFRRVATSILCIDPTLAATNNEVELALGDLRLHFDTKVGYTETTKTAAPPDVTAPPKAKANSAAEYLQKHHLETRLSEAMAAVLKERPEDPSVFMAQHLAGSSLKLAPPPKAPVNELNSNFSMYFRKHFKQAKSASLYSGFKVKTAPEEVQGSNLSTKGFAPYFREHFHDVGSATLYAGFGRAAAKPAVDELSSGFAAYFRKNFHQVPGGTSLYAGFPSKAAGQQSVAIPTDPAAGFGEYFKAHFTQPTNASTSSLYSKFNKSGAMPAPKTGDTPPRRHLLPSCGSYHGPTSFGGVVAPKFKPQASSAPLFSVRPSVGTWLTPLCKEPRKAAALATTKKSDEPQKFQLKPSVGTWLSVRKKPFVPTPKASPSPPPGNSFALKPSVGTWLAPNPAALYAKPQVERPTAATSGSDWAMRPSVGTWLIRKPKPFVSPASSSAPSRKAVEQQQSSSSKSVAPQPVVPARKKINLPGPVAAGLNTIRFGPGFWSMGISPVVTFL